MAEEVRKETMEDYSKELEASFKPINEGDIVSGTVISVNFPFLHMFIYFLLYYYHTYRAG